MDDAIVDLAARWRRARCAALSAVLRRPRDREPEAALLASALDADTERVLRVVFDHSLLLGQGFRRWYQVDLTLSDLVGVLPGLGNPCAAATWEHRPAAAAYVSERSACDFASAHPRACDYWREALHGLVLGLTSNVHHARHESAGNGGARCIDALYVSAQSPARFAPIPDDVGAGLAALCRTARMFDSSTEIEFLGITENILHYTVRSTDATRALDLTRIIQRGVARRFPWLCARDASPRAVLTDDPTQRL